MFAGFIDNAFLVSGLRGTISDGHLDCRLRYQV